MKDKELLESIISDYYNSVEDSFFYRLKNSWKIETSTSLLVLSTFLLIFNILPLFPFLIGDFLLWILNKIKPILGIEIEEYSFWHRWAFGIFLSIIIFFMFFLNFRHWNSNENKKAIKKSHLDFCYTYTIRKEIKSYLINDNDSHLENIYEYFQKIISKIITSPFYEEKRDSAKEISLHELRNKLVENHSWIQFNDESKSLIDAFESIKPKIETRINQKEELDKILPFIDILTLYQFSFIKPNFKNTEKLELGNQQFNYLKEIDIELSKLEKYKVQTVDEIKSSKIKSFFHFVLNLFTRPNILILFFSWLFLLALVFVPFSILIIEKLNIVIDSTIIIGLLSAPFVGAITIAVAIYSKNKK